MANNPEHPVDYPALQDLQRALQRLDQRLEGAIAIADSVYGREAATDSNRGLYISDIEVQTLLAREPGQPLFFVEQSDLVAPSFGVRLRRLQQTFQLSDIDLDLILIALAPEIDLRYERLYAYLQDDVTRKLPTVNLALNLLCDSFKYKLEQRQRLTSTAPLIQHRLIHVVADPNPVESSFLAHYLKVDLRIIQFLLGEDDLDPQLTPCCHLSQSPLSWQDVPLAAATRDTLQAVLVRAQQLQHPLRVYLQGIPGVGKQRVAAAIASTLHAPLLRVNLVQTCDLRTTLVETLRLMQREAQLQAAILYLSGVDDWIQQNASAIVYLSDLLNRFSGAVILAGHQAWIRLNCRCPSLVSVVLEPLDAPERRCYWHRVLPSVDTALKPTDIDALAEQFRLTPEQMDGAIAIAHHHPHSHGPLTLVDLIAAARQQSGQELSALTQKLTPHYHWEDIVLPADQCSQLQDICRQARFRGQVYREWGFDQKLSRGKGLNMLFTGPPGTGKTMAAEVIANELHLDLYKIDLSQVVSKYIGETEKNLDRIFIAAQTANAILFFDEADALFGKRSEVKDAHDRYANIEVGYLLQKMEEYEGITILATNLRQNMDEAFVRRIQMIVEFPFPDEESRHRIWQGIFPSALPMADDVDLELLAREVKLPGGNIKNIGLAAAFSAASEDGVMRMEHLIKAAWREHQKLGKSWQFQMYQ